jgi:hypothetical protein
MTDSAGSGHAPFQPPVANAPGLSSIRFRIGDFSSLRDVMLQPRAGEHELVNWRPGGEGDLALQMIEWWAYIADILTFYDERIANESYLRTAALPESVAHLVQTLGYRPRPALGAKGFVAGLLSSGVRPPVNVPQGLQVQSKPGPGQPPQVFEVDTATALNAPDLVLADVVPSEAPLFSADQTTIWLAGKVTGVKPGDRLLLINAAAFTTQTASDYAWIKVAAVTPAKDQLGATVTALSLAFINNQITGAGLTPGAAGNYTLVKPRQSSPLWTYATSSTVSSNGAVQLAGLARGVQAGSLILIDVADTPASIAKYWELPLHILTGFKDVLADFVAAPDASRSPREMRRYVLSNALDASYADLDFNAAAALAKALAAPPFSPTPVIVTSYTEAIWYANGDGPSNTVTPPIGMPSATIAFDAWANAYGPPTAAAATVRWDWIPIGALVPVLTSDDDYVYAAGDSLVADAASKSGFADGEALAMLEDVNGLATQAVVTASAGTATLGDPSPPAALQTPIEVFFNLIPVSQGKSVASETLGSGDARVSGQDFTLANSPVTYFADAAAVSGDGFSSTVQVSVNGVQWQETRSFFGQGPTDQVFVLREDDQGQTHVTFGDGTNGARLPTGVGNIVAAYRFGAGGTAPAPETLTTVLQPTPGLQSVRNPLPPIGGADPDSPARVRTLAPGSVMTLGRVVSIDDYAVTAAGAGGVLHAASSFDVDPVSQRPMATVWVAGDDGVVATASAALAAAGAAMGTVRVLAASPIVAQLQIDYLRDPRYAQADVEAALTTALLDPDTGLLGANVLGIGQVVYDSQIAAVCMSVTGVVVVASLIFSIPRPRFVPFILRRGGGQLSNGSSSGVRHDPGTGNYFSVPNDGAHLFLSGALAP